MKKEWVSIFVVLFVAVCVAPLPAWAGLENPVPQSVKSGVSVVSGWICDAEELEVSFDGGPRQFVPYGSERSDTAGVCGDTDNGFGLLINYNNLGDGEHTITLYVDGRVETTRTFFVGTFGEPFLRGVNGVGRIALSGGQSVVVGWSEAIQGFTILGYTDVPRLRAFGSFIGTWRFTGGGSGLTFTKTYQLSLMETNMAHQGITHLRGTDGEDQQAVFFLRNRRFTTGLLLTLHTDALRSIRGEYARVGTVLYHLHYECYRPKPPRRESVSEWKKCIRMSTGYPRRQP